MRLDSALLRQELDRKIFHVAWALLPLLYYAGYPRAGMLLLLFAELLIWAGIEMLRHRGLDLIPPGLMREHEKRGAPMGTLYQIAAMFLAVLIFDRDVAILAMLFCCVGDSVTAFAGALLAPYLGRGRTAIRDYPARPLSYLPAGDFRHALAHRKSPALMLVMFIACLGLGVLFFRNMSLYILLAGCAGAVIADAFAWRLAGFTLDDDLIVPLFAGVAMTLVALV